MIDSIDLDIDLAATRGFVDHAIDLPTPRPVPSAPDAQGCRSPGHQ
jgi:hypothetical protein